MCSHRDTSVDDSEVNSTNTLIVGQSIHQELVLAVPL